VLVRAHRRNLNLIDKVLIAGCTAFACFGIGLPARVFSRPLIKVPVRVVHSNPKSKKLIKQYQI
jgi:hypothetical protein